MTNVPTWVPYAALGVSLAAVLVSLAALRLAYMSHRSAGPVIRLQWEVAIREHGPKPRMLMRLSVANTGRGPVSITGFGFVSEAKKDGAPVAFENRDLNGPDLPFRLEGNSDAEWMWNSIPAFTSFQVAQARSHYRQVSPFVRLGNGNVVYSRGTMHPAALLGSMFPGTEPV